MVACWRHIQWTWLVPRWLCVAILIPAACNSTILASWFRQLLVNFCKSCMHGIHHPSDFHHLVLQVEVRQDRTMPTKYDPGQLYTMVKEKGVLRPTERAGIGDRSQYSTRGLSVSSVAQSGLASQREVLCVQPLISCCRSVDHCWQVGCAATGVRQQRLEGAVWQAQTTMQSASCVGCLVLVNRALCDGTRDCTAGRRPHALGRLDSPRCTTH